MAPENIVPASDRSGAQALRWLILSAVIVGLDQWTKAIALAALQEGQSIAVFSHLNWTLRFNPGVAFSIFDDGHAWQRHALSAFALIISAVFTVMLTRLPQIDRATKLAFALVIGGAIGNVIDRIRFGHVVDFVDVRLWNQTHWPAFNIADSSICVGAFVLLVWGWKSEPRSAPAAVAKEPK